MNEERKEAIAKVEKMFDSSGRVTVTGKFELVLMMEQIERSARVLKDTTRSTRALENRARVWEDHWKGSPDAKVGLLKRLWSK